MKQFIKKTAAAAIASCIVCSASAAVCAIDPAASIGSVTYDSLNAALCVVKSGQTIVLQSDVLGKNETHPVGVHTGAAYVSNDSTDLSFTLDLHGYTISSDAEAQVGLLIQTGEQAGAREITIQNGTIRATGKDAAGLEIADQNAATNTSVILNNVTIQAEQDAGVQCFSSALHVDSSKIQGMSDAIYAEDAAISLKSGAFAVTGTDVGADGAIAAYQTQTDDTLTWKPDTVSTKQAMAVSPSDWQTNPAVNITAMYFTDIKIEDYFYQPVVWAVQNNITAGTSMSTFSPANGCTRAQNAAFLWRAAGCPEPKDTKLPFTDVPAGSWFEKAVCWAYEQGITAGTTKTTFSPDTTCTRGQVVTFLWRMHGSPEPNNTKSPFTDIKNSDYFYKASLWAQEQGITAGTSKTAFSPNMTCTRGQIVTFLYRDMAEE